MPIDLVPYFWLIPWKREVLLAVFARARVCACVRVCVRTCVWGGVTYIPQFVQVFGGDVIIYNHLCRYFMSHSESSDVGLNRLGGPMSSGKWLDHLGDMSSTEWLLINS